LIWCSKGHNWMGGEYTRCDERKGVKEQEHKMVRVRGITYKKSFGRLPLKQRIRLCVTRRQSASMIMRGVSLYLTLHIK